MNSRMKFLMGGLFLTMVAVIFAPEQESVANAVSRPSKEERVRSSTSIVIPRGEATDNLLALRSREGGLGAGIFFGTPKVQVVTMATPPMVEEEKKLPPLPFRVLGQYQDGKGKAVFLDDKGQGIVVREGDSLREETYRISEITEDEIRITYMPLQKIQTLALGDMP